MTHFKAALAFVLSVLTWNAAIGADDPVFDVPALVATPLNARTLKSSERDGIVTEEIRYHSETDGEIDVDIFAYFSYPKGAKKLPAYIWNPGGLGQASPAYTEGGAKRGYATLCIDFPQPGYRSTGNYPINSGLTVGDDPKRAPIYHGAVALLKAVSYLESRPEVDRNRIGMAGSSWGGFFTTLMVGIDPRLKAGASLYGCGNLQLGNAWWDGDSRNGRETPSAAERERWRTTLDPALRLPTKRTPMAWFTGTNDRFYLLPDVAASYEMAAGPKHLTFVPNWDHAMPELIHNESFLAWLDEHLKHKITLPTVTPIRMTVEGGVWYANWTVDGDIQSADLIASYGEEGNWVHRYWHTLPVKIDGLNCKAELVRGGPVCYLAGSVVDRNGLRTSTPLLRLEAKSLGGREELDVPNYNGCQEWGSFEPKQIAYLKRHDQSGQTRWVPQVKLDARIGQQSAIVEPGTTVLPPILSTPNIEHRFSAHFKSPKPVTVVVQLGDQLQSVEVGSEWTELAIEYTPLASLMGGFPATIRVPEGAKVLLDDVRFHLSPRR